MGLGEKARRLDGLHISRRSFGSCGRGSLAGLGKAKYRPSGWRRWLCFVVAASGA